MKPEDVKLKFLRLNPANHAIYETGELIARRPIPADVRETTANNLRGLYPAYDTTFADWPFESWLLQGGRNA